ncbi:MAG TPA: HAD family hydrolase [Gemmatimonadaceae bacterium]|nr:HAD family hydrolase [Gemmatimonadaceae bacterium]
MDGPPADVASGVDVEAVLLDVDGTLVDSTGAHARAWSDAFRETGREIGPEAVRALVGMGSDKLLPKLTGIDAESDEGKRLIARRMEIFSTEYLPGIQPFDRARELVERLRAAGLRTVVATSANDDELRGLMQVLGTEWLLEDATNSSDADRSKPDPDIVMAAVDKTGVGAAHCVMIGDTPYDVEAATRAGVRIIGVRCGGWGDESLRGAIEIYDDPADLLGRSERSVLAEALRPLGGARGAKEGARARAASAERGVNE